MTATPLNGTARCARLASFLALLVGAIGGAAATEPPRALYNRSVMLSWIEYRVQRCNSGETARGNTNSLLQIYVSDAGRLFSRLNRRAGGQSNSTDADPEGGANRTGTGASRLDTHFEDRQLLVDTPMRSGARRVQVTFDASFATCSLEVRFGKEGRQGLYHRTMDGRMCTIISTDVSRQTCAIQSGNAFAGK